MTATTTKATTTPLPGNALEDPVGVAEQLCGEFRVGAAERDRERTFPYEQCAAFRASGLLGLMVPRAHGGYGGTFTDLMKVVIAISAGDSNIGQMCQPPPGQAGQRHAAYFSISSPTCGSEAWTCLAALPRTLP